MVSWRYGGIGLLITAACQTIGVVLSAQHCQHLWSSPTHNLVPTYIKATRQSCGEIKENMITVTWPPSSQREHDHSHLAAIQSKRIWSQSPGRHPVKENMITVTWPPPSSRTNSHLAAIQSDKLTSRWMLFHKAGWVHFTSARSNLRLFFQVSEFNAIGRRKPCM